MQIKDKDWHSVTKQNPDEMHVVGSWLDRGVFEELMASREDFQLYRRRSWGSRFSGENNEVWFVFRPSIV